MQGLLEAQNTRLLAAVRQLFQAQAEELPRALTDTVKLRTKKQITETKRQELETELDDLGARVKTMEPPQRRRKQAVCIPLLLGPTRLPQSNPQPSDGAHHPGMTQNYWKKKSEPTADEKKKTGIPHRS